LPLTADVLNPLTCGSSSDVMLPSEAVLRPLRVPRPRCHQLLHPDD
jgi:hypothetical protein